MTDLVEGDAAPLFSLALDKGGAVGSGDFRGRSLALYFYPKDDTPGCTRQAQAFDARAEAFRAVGCTVLGVSPDSADRHAKFRAKYALSIPLASDENKAVLQAYGVWKQKSMYGRTFMGVERSTFLIGPDGRIRRIWRKVKVPGHAEEVLQAAADLQSSGSAPLAD